MDPIEERREKLYNTKTTKLCIHLSIIIYFIFSTVLIAQKKNMFNIPFILFFMLFLFQISIYQKTHNTFLDILYTPLRKIQTRYTPTENKLLRIIFKSLFVVFSSVLVIVWYSLSFVFLLFYFIYDLGFSCWNLFFKNSS